MMGPTPLWSTTSKPPALVTRRYCDLNPHTQLEQPARSFSITTSRRHRNMPQTHDGSTAEDCVWQTAPNQNQKVTEANPKHLRRCQQALALFLLLHPVMISHLLGFCSSHDRSSLRMGRGCLCGGAPVHARTQFKVTRCSHMTCCMNQGGPGANRCGREARAQFKPCEGFGQHVPVSTADERVPC